MLDLQSHPAQGGLALLIILTLLAAACAGTRATETVDAAAGEAVALPSASVSADGGPAAPDALAQSHEDPPRARSAGDGGSPTDLSYEGTYRSGENAIKLLKVDASRAKFDVYAQNARYNSGYATGDVAVDRNGATYVDNTSGHCTIRMDFAPGGKLRVTQQGEDCGFGLGVAADGIYTKVSSARPTVGVDPRISPAPPATTPHLTPAPPHGKAGDSCYDGNGPTPCPTDDEFLCARDNCQWRVPPGAGCDSPGNCIHHRAAPAPPVKLAPAVAATPPKGAIGKCAPGEQGGVGYVCTGGYKVPH
jgi:hypothetical protein